MRALLFILSLLVWALLCWCWPKPVIYLSVGGLLTLYLWLCKQPYHLIAFFAGMLCLTSCYSVRYAFGFEAESEAKKWDAYETREAKRWDALRRPDGTIPGYNPQ